MPRLPAQRAAVSVRARLVNRVWGGPADPIREAVGKRDAASSGLLR
jgi:hypothetical protein